MESLIYRHFDVIEKFIQEFKEGQSFYKSAIKKTQQMQAEHKMNLVIFNFEIYTSKYPELYQYLVGNTKDEYQQRSKWDSLRCHENFVAGLQKFLKSVSISYK